MYLYLASSSMSLSLSFLKYGLISVASFLYSQFILYLLGFTDYVSYISYDLSKYYLFYSGVTQFDSFPGIFAYALSCIGSADLYALIVRFIFAPYISFENYLRLQVFLFVFLLCSLFFRNCYHTKQPLRYLVFFTSLFSIYTLGLSTTILRLQLSLIFLFLSVIFNDRSFFRNLFYCLSFLTHVTSILIILPLYFTNLPSRIRPFAFVSPRFTLPSLISPSKLILSIFMLFVFSNLAYSKFLIWLPSFFSTLSLKSILSAFMIYFLLFPLIISKNNSSKILSSSNSFIPLLSILPITGITLLIGGFRTLILAYFMSLMRLTSTRTPFLNSGSFFLSLYPYFMVYSVFTGCAFIDKLLRTGSGY